MLRHVRQRRNDRLSALLLVCSRFAFIVDTTDSSFKSGDRCRKSFMLFADSTCI